MPINRGKIFEDEFKNSVSRNVYIHRLADAASAFSGGQVTRFSVKNPFDFIMFSEGLLMPLELKTTEQGAMSWETKKDKKKGKNIKLHQIEGLRKANSYDGVRGGFLLQFTNKETAYIRTYWLSIGDFDCMIEDLEGKKKSFNEKDLKQYNAYEVFTQLKQVHYHYDIDDLIRYIRTLEGLKIPKAGRYKIELCDEKDQPTQLEVDLKKLREMGVDI